MVLEELNSGKFHIQDGKIYSMTPITTLELVEREIRKEVANSITKNSTKEIILKMLGSAIEYFTENGWRISFLSEHPNLKLLIAAPFKGGIMRGSKEGTQYKIYIPSGYLAMEIEINNFPFIRRIIRLLPELEGFSLRELFDKYRESYQLVHPHLLDKNELCNGLPDLNKFNLDMIVAQIEACIDGGSRSGTSIWSYNRDSPAVTLDNCKFGKKAYLLYKKKKTDQQIWNELLGPAKEEEVNDDDIEDEEFNEEDDTGDEDGS